jgi:hypothetical protein
MTYSASDLQADLDHALNAAGFWITGDDDDTGWGYAFGVTDSGTDLDQGLDSSAEASQLALVDLLGRVEELQLAARRVSDCWTTGKLAEAVQALDRARLDLDPQAQPSTKPMDRNRWLRDRLQALAGQGLTLSDCLEVLGVPTETDPKAREACLQHARPGVLEFGSHTAVSNGPGGSHVLAWVWVAD